MFKFLPFTTLITLTLLSLVTRMTFAWVVMGAFNSTAYRISYGSATLLDGGCKFAAYKQGGSFAKPMAEARDLQAARVDGYAGYVYRGLLGGLSPLVTYVTALECPTSSQSINSLSVITLQPLSMSTGAFKFIMGIASNFGPSEEVVRAMDELDRQLEAQQSVINKDGSQAFKQLLVLGGMADSTTASWTTVLDGPLARVLAKLPLIFLPNAADQKSIKSNLQQTHSAIFPQASEIPTATATYYAYTVTMVRFLVLDTVTQASPGSGSLLGPAQLAWLKSELAAWKDYWAVVLLTSVPWSGSNTGWGNACCSQERTAIANWIKQQGVANLLVISGANFTAFDTGNGTDYATGYGGGFPTFVVGPAGLKSQSTDASYSQGCSGYTGAATTQFGMLTFQSSLSNGGKTRDLCFTLQGSSLTTNSKILALKCRTIIIDKGVLDDKAVTIPYPTSWLSVSSEEDQKAAVCNLPAYPADTLALIVFGASMGAAVIIAIILYFCYRRYKVYKRRLQIAGLRVANGPSGSRSMENLMVAAEPDDALGSLPEQKKTTYQPKRNRRASVMNERDAAEIPIQIQDEGNVPVTGRTPASDQLDMNPIDPRSDSNPIDPRSRSNSSAKNPAEIDPRSRSNSTPKNQAEFDPKSRSSSTAKNPADLDPRSRSNSSAKNQAELDPRSRSNSNKPGPDRLELDLSRSNSSRKNSQNNEADLESRDKESRVKKPKNAMVKSESSRSLRSLRSESNENIARGIRKIRK